MKSEWRVTANPTGGKMLYGVYRLRDVDAIDHSGNREVTDRWFDDRGAAEAVAFAMNEQEGTSDEVDTSRGETPEDKAERSAVAD